MSSTDVGYAATRPYPDASPSSRYKHVRRPLSPYAPAMRSPVLTCGMVLCCDMDVRAILIQRMVLQECVSRVRASSVGGTRAPITLRVSGTDVAYAKSLPREPLSPYAYLATPGTDIGYAPSRWGGALVEFVETREQVCAMLLRAPYAVSVLPYRRLGVSLTAPYAISGTDLAYVATRGLFSTCSGRYGRSLSVRSTIRALVLTPCYRLSAVLTP
eukprot:2266677-Rhodomonas_salina.7